MHRSVLAFVVVVPLAAGCVSTVAGAPRPGTTLPTTTTEQPKRVGSYGPGDCLVIEDNVRPISCAEPHDYEVTLSDNLPAGVPDTFPPELDTVVGPTCMSAVADYTGSPDADASLLTPAFVWPHEPEWAAGERWFACLVSEDGPDGKAVRRTGSVRDALTDGVGSLRQCLVDGTADPGPTRLIRCDQPHRSEAVPPVIVLGKASDPAPTAEEIIGRTHEPCSAAVSDYLDGERPGVSWGVTYGSPEQWPKGFVTATCFAVSDAPVTGLMSR